MERYTMEQRVEIVKIHFQVIKILWKLFAMSYTSLHRREIKQYIWFNQLSFKQESQWLFW